MPFFLLPLTLADLFFALSSVADRFLLVGSLPHPRAYAFTTAVTGISAVLLIPFGVRFLSLPLILTALFTGLVSLLAFAVYYEGLRRTASSRFVPMVGALLPAFVLGFAAIADPDDFRFTRELAAATTLLVAGTVFLSLRAPWRVWRPSRDDLRFAAAAAVLFALGIILTKYLYIHVGFINGIAWTNFGSFIAAPLLLLSKGTRQALFTERSWRRRNVVIPLLLGKGLGGLGSLLQQYAVFLVSYAQLPLISALQGIQYLFLLIIAAAVSLKNPSLLREELTAQSAPLRVFGIALIAAGVAIIAR